jgi:hypothetical protein
VLLDALRVHLDFEADARVFQTFNGGAQGAVPSPAISSICAVTRTVSSPGTEGSGVLRAVTDVK